MNLKNKVNIHNRFDIEVRDAKTGLLKKSLTSYNIVLNQMYTRLCGGLSYFVNIHFGSSTGTLLATRTSLFSHLGTKAAIDEEIIKAIPLSIWKRKIVLNPEEFVGSTISEVGIAFGSNNTNLVTHSLLKDSEGNPISIVKTDVDVITIYATVFVTFDNSNPNLRYIGMPSSNALVNYLIGGSGAPTGAFSVNDIYLGNSRLGSTSNATWTSDTANKQRKTNVLRFGTTVGNGQVKFLEFANVFSLEFPYSPVFNGQSYEGVSLGVGDGVVDEFSLPSRFIKPESLLIKKNGVVVYDYDINDSQISYRTSRQIVTSGTGQVGVMFSGDGNVLLNIEVNSPYIYLYNVSEFGIYEDTNIPNVNGRVVLSGSLNYDGSIIVVGVSSAPYFMVFDKIGNSWVYRETSVSVDGYSSVYISENGLAIAIGDNVFDWVVDEWVSRPKPSGSFGVVDSILCFNNGNTIYYISDKMYVFDWVMGTWVGRTALESGLNSAAKINVSLDGLIVGYLKQSSTTLQFKFWDGSSWISRPSISPVMSSTGFSMNWDASVVLYGVASPTRLFKALWNGSGWVDATPLNSTLFHASGYSYKDVYYYGISSGFYTFQYFIPIVFKKVKFNTPPAIGDVITADYTVDGVHKTDQYVIDASMAIQFGEGI